MLNVEAPDNLVSEMESWNSDNSAPTQNAIDNAVSTFNNQISDIKAVASTLSINQPAIQLKLKTLQDMSLHLSFHLGEIILLRRLCKTYPEPEQMKEFLA